MAGSQNLGDSIFAALISPHKVIAEEMAKELKPVLKVLLTRTILFAHIFSFLPEAQGSLAGRREQMLVHSPFLPQCFYSFNKYQLCSCSHADFQKAEITSSQVVYSRGERCLCKRSVCKHVGLQRVEHN